jgi:hypothetical protein
MKAPHHQARSPEPVTTASFISFAGKRLRVKDLRDGCSLLPSIFYPPAVRQLLSLVIGLFTVVEDSTKSDAKHFIYTWK